MSQYYEIIRRTHTEDVVYVLANSEEEAIIAAKKVPSEFGLKTGVPRVRPPFSSGAEKEKGPGNRAPSFWRREWDSNPRSFYTLGVSTAAL